MRISFIIPAYNASKTIITCLDSIYSLPLQEYEYEVVVVDDCSTDNTINIINDYAQIHTNLVIFQQAQNKRQGAARNRGVKIAKGDYIAFVDADDEIVSEGIMNALDAVQKTEVDICYYDFEYEMPKDVWHRWSTSKELQNKIISSADYLNNHYTCDYNAPWRTLYKNSFLQKSNIAFEEGVRWEDCDWTIKVYYQSNTIQFVEGVGYRYKYGENATSRQKTTQAMYERVLAGIRLLQFAHTCEYNGLKKIIQDEAYRQYIIAELRLRNLTKYSYKEIVRLLDLMEISKRQYIYNHTNGWVSFFTKYTLLSKVLLFIACPIACIGRKLMNLKRKLL